MRNIDTLGFLFGLFEFLAFLAVLWLAWRFAAYVLLLVRRADFAVRLGRFMRGEKLRLKWVRPWFASAFGGIGEIDFVIDGRIHVALLSTVRRRVQYQLGEERLLLISTRRLTSSARSGISLRLVNNSVQNVTAKGNLPHALGRCDAPADDARVLIVYPAPLEVNDCSDVRLRSLVSGDRTVGGFQFNTRSHFFARLEEYARTGDMSIWQANAPRKEKY